jgi:hypothetical protein
VIMNVDYKFHRAFQSSTDTREGLANFDHAKLQLDTTLLTVVTCQNEQMQRLYQIIQTAVADSGVLLIALREPHSTAQALRQSSPSNCRNGKIDRRTKWIRRRKINSGRTLTGTVQTARRQTSLFVSAADPVVMTPTQASFLGTIRCLRMTDWSRHDTEQTNGGRE